MGASNDYENFDDEVDDDEDDEDDLSVFKSRFHRKGSLDESSGEKLRKMEGIAEYSN